MKNYTWNDLCAITGLDFEELTGEQDCGIGDDLANGTVLGDEIIKDLAAYSL